MWSLQGLRVSRESSNFFHCASRIGDSDKQITVVFREGVRKMQWAENEIGLDSSQNRSKFSFSSLKMALNCL